MNSLISTLQFRAIFVLLVMLSSALSFGQTTNRISVLFTTGDRGLAHTLILRMELMGGDAGDRVLASGEFNPPEPNGLASRTSGYAVFTLDREVNLRMVRRARFTVRGDRPGQDITTSWDVKAFRVTYGDLNTTLFDYPTLNNIVLNVDRPSWTTPGWITYDAAGIKSPLRNLNLIIKTGGDDLRRDSATGAVVIFANGITTKFDLGNSRGIPGNEIRTLTLPIVPGQNVNDIVAVHLFKSIYNGWTDFNYAHLIGIQKYTNADTWKVAYVRLDGLLRDGTRVTKELPELAGDYTSDMRSYVRNEMITPLPSARTTMEHGNVRLGIVFDDTSLSVRNSDNPPEVFAHVRFRGNTEWVPFVVRTNATMSYLNSWSATGLWHGDAAKFSGHELGGSTKNCYMFADNPIWVGRELREITAIKLSLHNGAGGGDPTFGIIAGRGQVRVRGVLLGLPTRGLVAGQWTWSNVLTLSADFSRTVTLNRTTPEAIFTVRHGIPAAVAR